MLRRVVRIGRSTLLCCQFFLGIYCGYFGGAVGIMTLAVWSLLGMTDIKAMNATKTLVVGATNAIAVVCFILAGKVWWPQTVVMLIAAIVGGYGGARFARRLPAQRLRRGITVFNFMITCIFFCALVIEPVRRQSNHGRRVSGCPALASILVDCPGGACRDECGLVVARAGWFRDRPSTFLGE